MSFDYKAYREQRYKNWWNSGKWSYNENARFKADFINKFIIESGIIDVIEVGSWDGNNLSLYEAKKYTWVDVSAEAIKKCKNMFEHKDNMTFEEYRKWENTPADLSLCLDVTYHIFPRKEREEVIDDVIRLWKKYVLFYSFLAPKWHAQHINDYPFREYIEKLSKEKWYDLRVFNDTIPPDSNSRFVLLIK